MGEEAAVAIRDLFVSYQGVDALRDVTLRIERGEFVAVVGPNGGGKTTLLRAILGLVAPRRGTIHVLGRPPRAARADIGYLPQYFPFDQLFPVTVADVVLMGRLRPGWAAGRYSSADRDAADQALRWVGLAAAGARTFNSLSGGERQRVLLARALATDPKLVLLDEPLAHVDAGVTNELYRLFRELSATRTVVLVSHDVGFVSSLVSRVVCVNRTVSIHPTSELSGELVSRLYGTDVSMVRHDHDCRRGGEPCTTS